MLGELQCQAVTTTAVAQHCLPRHAVPYPEDHALVIRFRDKPARPETYFLDCTSLLIGTNVASALGRNMALVLLAPSFDNILMCPITICGNPAETSTIQFLVLPSSDLSTCLFIHFLLTTTIDQRLCEKVTNHPRHRVDNVFDVVSSDRVRRGENDVVSICTVRRSAPWIHHNRVRFRQSKLVDTRRNVVTRWERHLGRLILHELDRPEQTATSYIADVGMLRYAAPKPPPEKVAHGAHIGEQIVLLDDLLDGHYCRTADGVSLVRVTMRKGSVAKCQ